MTVYVKPLKCRPYVEVMHLNRSEWTSDEKSAFRKFNPDANADKFIREWEQTCNRLNPNRKKMKYDW